MSCMSNIDPYNNAPPGKCGSGSCSSKQSQMNQQYQPQPQPPMNQAYPQYPPPLPQQQQQYAGKTSAMTRRPMQTPGNLDPMIENQMLYSDLQTAIQYIYQLGGKWPPPGH
jgi:hypothetical protein